MNILYWGLIFLLFFDVCNSFIFMSSFNNYHDRNRYNPFKKGLQNINTDKQPIKKYPIISPEFTNLIKKLNSRDENNYNNNTMLNSNYSSQYFIYTVDNDNNNKYKKIPLSKSNFLRQLGINIVNNDEQNNDEQNDDDDNYRPKKMYFNEKTIKSKNFEVIRNFDITFKDVGGYDNVKNELHQCVDILNHFDRYSKYNVRIPKGLILEGPPGTGKTLIAKALAGESKCNFIAVSGSDFQEKYVGIGPTRIKELFDLAKKNIPCIIFIDEIDAVGRKRSSDGESSSNERDNTLNALLVELDGFKNNSCVFLVGATNRVDLLDPALVRPGRIDKKIFIGLPDKKTREAIVNVHIKGKPHCETLLIEEIVELTEGISGAQIENLLNEAMLNALRNNNTEFCFDDFNFIMDKMIAGWQPVEHEFTSDIIDHIVIHEMGHTIVGLLSKYHSKVSKVTINLSSPKSPGYTVFEGSTSNIYTREALFEHLMILLGGRIAEEVFYNVSVTTGAINDFEEALKLAEKMIIYYGMGNNVIYPSLSETYKELIDNEVANLLNEAYKYSQIIISQSKDFIKETSEILKKDKIIKANELNELIKTKYKYLEDINFD